jgi:hypothetical protein
LSPTPYKASPRQSNEEFVEYVDVYSPLLSHKHQVALDATIVQAKKVLKWISRSYRTLTIPKIRLATSSKSAACGVFI